MVLSRHLARALRAASLLVLLLSAFFGGGLFGGGHDGILQAGGGRRGKRGRPPQPKEVPDPEAKRAKERAAAEREKIERKRKGTVATSPQGVLGAAPTTRPELKGTLG